MKEYPRAILVSDQRLLPDDVKKILAEWEEMQHPKTWRERWHRWRMMRKWRKRLKRYPPLPIDWTKQFYE